MYKYKKHIGIRILLLAIFLGYFADITFFVHSHFIQGITVIHSHYFKGYSEEDPTKPAKHTHTEAALTLISQANACSAIILQAPEIRQITQPLWGIIPIGNTLSGEQAVSVTSYLRGPPFKI